MQLVLGASKFGVWAFGILSDFGTRISDFLAWRSVALTYCLLLFTLHLPAAQPERDRNSYNPRAEGWFEGGDHAKTAREAPFHSFPTPTWTNRVGFEKDVFSFARVRYTRLTRGGRVWWNGGYWYSDSPDSDLNLSFRLQQMTSLKVNPDGRFIDLTDPELFDYPWIYMVEPGMMVLDEDEVAALRKYLLNGGFLMADDFWGLAQWANFEREMRRVFPNRPWTDLDIQHQIFHSVYDLKGPLEKLQIPNVEIGRRAELTGVTWEYHEQDQPYRREACKDIHFRAMFDDKNRIVALGCYNTDNGDGWEREGDDVYFFHRFSENIAYPLAINIIVYTMTH
jgi:hypothetical protein